MKRIRKQLTLSLILFIGLLALTGYRILEEDPNEAQIPWATPAQWEGTVPGMPTQTGGY